jgi:hypothetical protein
MSGALWSARQLEVRQIGQIDGKHLADVPADAGLKSALGEGFKAGDIVISQIVWGQLRGHRGGGIDLSFVRVDDTTWGSRVGFPERRMLGVRKAASSASPRAQTDGPEGKA